MPLNLLSADDFRAAAKEGGNPEATVFRFAPGEAVTVGDAKARTKRFVFSDATVDHSNDSIDPKGWDLKVFNRNPVALFSHASWEPPIGRASNVSVQGDKLVGDIEFASADVYPFADTIYRLVDGGFLKAVSVGFMPKEWAFSSDKNRPYGIDFKKQLLAEISVCAVPANPSCLIEARSLGIDTAPLVEWAEKVLDSGETVFLPRRELETLRIQAKGADAPRFYVQGDRDVSPKGMERMRESFKRWRDDPNELLLLEPGFTLRAVETEHRSTEDWTCGADRDLALDGDGSWDGPAAEASIFEYAGGDDFDPSIARKGFLAYDAAAPKLRGSYKLPFAHVENGAMRAMASGIRAAASRLPQTDIPDGVKSTAKAVLDHYEEKMGDKTISEIFSRLKIEIDHETLRELDALVAKAGRKVSAATKAKLQEAMGHHEAMGKCMQDIMDSDEANPSEDPEDASTDNEIPAQPEATVVPEDMSPEERRLKRVADLRAELADFLPGDGH